MERLERIQSDYYSASKLIDLTRFLATYKEISQLERCNHEKLMKIIIHDLANNFFVLSYAMLSQLRGDALVEGVIDYIRGVKGYKGRITNFYMKISGYSIRERISQIEQFISQNPSIKREYKKNNGVKK